MNAEYTKAIEETRKSLERMQKFDPNSLPREQELGKSLNFNDAVEPATRLIDLYRQLPDEVLEQLPQKVLGQH